MSSFGSNVLTTTIPSGSSLSSAMELGDNALVAVIISADVTVTFQGSMDKVTFYDIFQDSGSPQEYQVVCKSTAMQTLDLNQFLAPRWVKVRVGTSASPSAVGSSTTVILVSKEV